MGQFEPGKSGNPLGRPKGSKNKVSEEIREKLSAFVNTNIDTIIDDFKKMKPSYRWKFFSELLPYVTPRLSATTNQHSYEKMTDEDLNAIIDELIKTANNEHED